MSTSIPIEPIVLCDRTQSQQAVAILGLDWILLSSLPSASQ
ncbi:hypothetical protein [Microcoleus sp. CAWBG58]|nr:hypothetical protein [Microcoleus sp. CAWBG58]